MSVIKSGCVTGVVRNEMESSHTVVTSRSVVASDGSVSLSRDVIQGIQLYAYVCITYSSTRFIFIPVTYDLRKLVGIINSISVILNSTLKLGQPRVAIMKELKTAFLN